jgi:hypothetical protein
VKRLNLILAAILLLAALPLLAVDAEPILGMTCDPPRPGILYSYPANGKLFACLNGVWARIPTGPDLVAQGVGQFKNDIVTGIPKIATPGVDYPAWQKYSVVFIANAAADCVSVNGGASVPAAGGLTQSAVLFQLPAKGMVEFAILKTATACTGTTTLVATVGDAGGATKFRSATYDLKASVGDTNVAGAPALAAPSSAAAANVVLGLTSTVENLTSVVAGCAVNVYLKWGVLP